MSDLFLKVLNMSISASWIILAILLLRLVLKRAPKWVNPLLWCIAGLRLVMPFSIESALSLLPSAETVVTGSVGYATVPVINSGFENVNTAVNGAMGNIFTPPSDGIVGPAFVLTNVIALIWLLGAVAMAVYALVSWYTLRRRVATATKLEGNVYESEFVSTPFVLGIFRPKIYLPYSLTEEERRHVLAHERAHIARRDNWIKPLGFAILCLHWFNPLVWLAYILLCRDIEYACDERVVKNMGVQDRAGYSEALLSCSVHSRRIAACPLAFGEGGVKGRVRGVLSYKRPAFWIIAVALASCAVLAVCFLTDPVSSAGETPTETENPFDSTMIAVGFYDEDIPESVIEAARTYVADQANRWAETGAHNSELGLKNYSVTGGSVSSLELIETGVQADLDGGWEGELCLARVGYYLDLSSYEDFVAIGSVSVDENGRLTDSDAAYLLLIRENNDGVAEETMYSLMWYTSESAIDEIYASPSVNSQYPDKYTAAAHILQNQYNSYWGNLNYGGAATITFNRDEIPGAVMNRLLANVTYDAYNGWTGYLAPGESAGEVSNIELTGTDVIDAGSIVNGGSEYNFTFYKTKSRFRVSEPENFPDAVGYELKDGWVYAPEVYYLYCEGEAWSGMICGFWQAALDHFDTPEQLANYPDKYAAAAGYYANDLFERLGYGKATFEQPEWTTLYGFEPYTIGERGGWLLTPMLRQSYGKTAYYAYDYMLASGFVLTCGVSWDGDNIDLTGFNWRDVTLEEAQYLVIDGMDGTSAAIAHLKCDIYSETELASLAAQGIDIPENERQSGFWAVFLARPGESVGYLLGLSDESFSREDVIDFASSFSFGS